ncbi:MULTISPECIES: restriction endonuclease subunit S [unclassified Aeromicrobium]|uniref:restriction endonuclease subunit S n=1 Tax=unclassified Aeromicrobium TaxID=2633570 RepID=UPI00396B112F
MNRVALGQVVDFTNGGTPSRSKPEFWDGSTPWITGADIAEDGTISPRSFISDAAVKGSSTSVLPAGTVLLLTRTSVGKVGLLSEPMAINQDITAITPSSRLDRRYLVHFLRSSKARLLKHLRGATIKGVTRDDVAALELALPPLAEQRRIAAILDHADALRAKRRQALAHLDSLTQSIFNDMFGGVPATSTVKAEATLIRTGPFGSQLLHSEFVDDGIAVLGLDNVVGNEFRWGERRFITPAKYEQLKRYTVKPRDVLISIMGTTGRCVVVPADIPAAINTKHICAITPDTSRIDSAFLRAAFLWHPEALAHLRRQTKGSIMDGLNMGIIKAMPIPVPPMEAQRMFASRVDRVSASRRDVDLAATRENELFASLQSRAFRGEL